MCPSVYFILNAVTEKKTKDNAMKHNGKRLSPHSQESSQRWMKQTAAYTEETAKNVFMRYPLGIIIHQRGRGLFIYSISIISRRPSSHSCKAKIFLCMNASHWVKSIRLLFERFFSFFTLASMLSVFSL